MAQQGPIITSPINSGNGTPIANAFSFCQNNFNELYARAANTIPGNGTGNLMGVSTDQPGFYAFNSSLFYYCYGNYTGNTNIWGKVSQLNGDSSIINGTSNVSITQTGGNVGITVGNVNNVGVFSSTGLVVSGSVAATYLSGDGSNITGLYGNTQVRNYLASGTDTANIITTGNVRGNYIIGNGFALTNILANAIIGNVTAGTSNTAITVTANAQPNITSVGTLTSLSVTGNVTAAGFTTTGGTNSNITGVDNYLGNAITVTGNAAASYFIGDGSVLSNVNAGDLLGGNTNQIVYQSAANTTAFISAPATANTLLSFNGSAYTWANATAPGTAGNVLTSNGTNWVSTGFPGNIAPTGYSVLPNGLIMQWGTGNTLASASGNGSVTFPAPFTIAAYSFNAIYANATTPLPICYTVSSLTSTTANVVAQLGNTGAGTDSTFYWTAVGF